MPKTIAIVPCFNEAQRLDGEAFLACVREADDDVHFLFVNDGSTDETSPLLVRLCATAPSRMQQLDLNANVGKAEAVRLGILHALASGCDFVTLSQSAFPVLVFDSLSQGEFRWIASYSSSSDIVG